MTNDELTEMLTEVIAVAIEPPMALPDALAVVERVEAFCASTAAALRADLTRADQQADHERRPDLYAEPEVEL